MSELLRLVCAVRLFNHIFYEYEIQPVSDHAKRERTMCMMTKDQLLVVPHQLFDVVSVPTFVCEQVHRKK